MRKGLTLTLAAGLISSSLLVIPSWASTYSGSSGQSSFGGSSSEPSIDVDIANANLLSVVQLLKSESNAQIVVVSGHYEPVTLSINDMPLGDALQYVAQSAKAVVTKDGNGVYQFRPESDADAAAASLVQTSAPVAAPIQQNMHSERISLMYVDPNYILNMLNIPEGYRDSDPTDNPANDGPLNHPNISPILTTGPSNLPVTMNPTANGQNVVPASAPGAQGNYNGATVANDSAAGHGDQAQQAPFAGFGGGGVINPFQTPGGGAPGFGGAPGGFGGAPGGGANGQRSSLRPQGIDTIVANEQDNSLIVRGTPEGIAELRSIIGFFDRAPKQVQIKVQYITTTVNDADQFGISWDLIPFPNVDVNFNGNGTGSSSTQGTTLLSYAQGNLVARMQFLLQTTKGKLVNSLTITTTNNTPANANFSTVIPYTTSTTVAGGSTTTSNTSTNFITVPNTLTVTPRVNVDNSVSLLVNPTISTATQATPGTAPTVSTQSVSTYRTVANGETMVIGGLIVKQLSNGQFKVPFLSDLPIIGPLFRTRDLSDSGSELLIFVTPEVLPPIGADYGGISASGAATGEGTGVNADSGIGVGLGVSP